MKRHGSILLCVMFVRCGAVSLHLISCQAGKRCVATGDVSCLICTRGGRSGAMYHVPWHVVCCLVSSCDMVWLWRLILFHLVPHRIAPLQTLTTPPRLSHATPRRLTQYDVWLMCIAVWCLVSSLHNMSSLSPAMLPGGYESCRFI